MTNVRPPAVAGQFYADSAEQLEAQIRDCFEHELGPGSQPTTEPTGHRSLQTVVVPHAGLPFSGPIAAWGYDAIGSDGLPDTYLIVGPNHQGRGDPIAVPSFDQWKTPLGTVPIDMDLADRLLSASDRVTRDRFAHQTEHAVEVQLPFLQILEDHPTVLPIAMADQRPTTSRELGGAIETAIQPRADDALVIVSTDLTHYEPHERAQKLDEPVVEAIAATDDDTIASNAESGHTMCGPGPIIAGLTWAQSQGVTEGTVYQYGTSGDTGGDRDQVVGYTAIGIGNG